MNNEKKNVQHSFAKKMSAPLIFSPPKVTGYQQKQMEMEEEMNSDHPENEEETIQTEDEATTDDASETEQRKKELMMNLMEAMRLQQLADYNRCFYQPKNRNGSFFYFETASDEDDDAPEDSAIDSPVEKEPVFSGEKRNEQADDFLVEALLTHNSEDDELFHDSSSMEKKAFTSGEFYDNDLTAGDSQRETEFSFDDEDLLREGKAVLEEAIQEDFIEQDSEDNESSYDRYPLDEEEFISDECVEEDLAAVDSREETEFAFDDSDPFEETKGVLKEAIQEEDFIEQDPEDDEPFHEPHFIQEDEFISEESYEDLSAITIDSLEEDEFVFDDKDPNEEANDSPSIERKNGPYEMGYQQDEPRKEKHRQGLPKSAFLPDGSKKNRLPIAKLPVLLAKADIDLDIFDSFDLPAPIANLTKSDWTAHCLEGRVLLPSTTVFLKGVLVADIEYVSDMSTHSMQTTKLQIPWKTTIKVDWIYPPLMPSSSHGEYMFQYSGGKEPGFHREYHEQFAEQVQFELQSVRHVWTEELVSPAGTPKLLIQGSASLSINLLQPQYIELDSR
ncbi:hypothetical protein [Priestia abyssalis]|uniref:hypothetical protein n=1 Tax=Priestia abyssalis TaxID=1221450 RepID=UPI0009950B5F|nr:hypothetical protein [Priestia abyssalis]